MFLYLGSSFHKSDHKSEIIHLQNLKMKVRFEIRNVEMNQKIDLRVNSSYITIK